MLQIGMHEDLIYDVGMHKGEDTDYYLKKGFKVIGYEADPELASHCRRRFSSAIESGKLVLVEGAITEIQSGENGSKETRFYRNKDISVWGTVVSDWARRNELLGTTNETIVVPVVNFVDCLKTYGIPHYLKIDIEGMDIVCLKALKHFQIRPDYVSIESSKVSFRNVKEELKLLIGLGYTGFKAIQQGNITEQKEPDSSMEGRNVGYQFSRGSSGLFGTDLPDQWKNDKQILREYRLISIQYWLFGDYGILRNNSVSKALKKGLKSLLKKPIPGWYDTHARHREDISNSV